MMLAALGGLFVFQDRIVLYICIALIGYGNSNMFPLAFAQAMKTLPEKGNEISGLMVMGIFGGTVFPLLMGIVTDIIGSQMGAVAVMLACAVYLLAISKKIGK